MAKCPFCGLQLITHKNEDVQKIGELLSQSYNNELICFYPHIHAFCPNCFIPEIKPEQISQVLLKQSDFNDILSQELDSVDELRMARQAECMGYACELVEDVSGATLNYKSALDIIEARILDFEKKNLRNVHSKQGDVKVLVEQDLNEYADAKVYCDTLRELVATTSAKSFEKLGYLGILIHLDTIVELKDFMLADKMFALLNDQTTKIPEVLVKAKNQLEDRYIKIRKQSLKTQK